jgi:hypothetical protein
VRRRGIQLALGLAASGRERRVPGLFSRRASASAPTTWGGAYAFGRDPLGFGRTHGSKRFGLFAGTTHARRLGSRILHGSLGTSPARVERDLPAFAPV